MLVAGMNMNSITIDPSKSILDGFTHKWGSLNIIWNPYLLFIKFKKFRNYPGGQSEDKNIFPRKPTE